MFFAQYWQHLKSHDLRHPYAVVSLKSGDDVKTVQENLGHATASFTLDTYGHVTEKTKKDSEIGSRPLSSRKLIRENVRENKNPPLKFRTFWTTKADRIKKASGFGSNYGWGIRWSIRSVRRRARRTATCHRGVALLWVRIPQLKQNSLTPTPIWVHS